MSSIDQAPGVSMPEASPKNVRIWEGSEWESFCRQQMPNLPSGTVPAGLTLSNGEIHLCPELVENAEELQRVHFEELSHRNLGFPNESGKSEFTAKIFREALMMQAGYKSMSAEQILGEILGCYEFDSQQLKRAIRSAETICPEIDFEAALDYANTIRGDRGLDPLTNRSLEDIRALPQSIPRSGFKSPFETSYSDERLGMPLAAAGIFKWLFEDPKRKEAERRIQQRKDMREFRGHMQDHKNLIENLILRCCEAEERHDDSSGARLKKLLRDALAVDKFMQRCANSIETGLLVNRQVEVIDVFARTLKNVTAGIAGISVNVNMTGIGTSWGLAQEKLKKLEDGMQSLLDQVESFGDDRSAEVERDLDREVNQLISERLNSGRVNEKAKMRELQEEIAQLRQRAVRQD